MTDKDLYEAYKDYKLTKLVWYNDKQGSFGLELPSKSRIALNLSEQVIVNFKITENNVIVLDRWLPEFVLKNVIEQIRNQKDEGDQYLWAV